MHEKTRVFYALTVLAALLCGVVATGSARAEGAITSLSLSEGYDFTNVTVQITSTFVPSVDATIVVKDAAGTAVGSPVVKSIGSESVSVVVPLADGVKGRRCTVEVTAAGETTVAAYLNAGWSPDDFFSAVADPAPDGTLKNGSWSTTAPTVESGCFRIDSTQTVFGVTAQAGLPSSHKIVAIESSTVLDSYYLYDDITNDFTSAICAIALVTNEERSASADWDLAWMALTNGTTWVRLDSTPADTVLANYKTKIEVDYATTQPLVRYSIRKGDAAEWTELTCGGRTWLPAKADAADLSAVCFSGSAGVSNFYARLATSDVAATGTVSYASLTDAMAAAKSGGVAFALLTNVQVDPKTLAAGDYQITKNGKDFHVNDPQWKVSDGQGTKVVLGDTTVSVAKLAFVAAIGSGEGASPAYMLLQDALAAGANTNVILLANVAENVSSASAGVALDLNGHTLTGAKDAAFPVLKVSGSGASLAVFGGGAITGATTTAAVLADDGAKVYLDDLFVTNNAAKAIAAEAGGFVEVSNGWFQANGGFSTDDGANSKILFVNGFYADAAAYENLVKATGGYFADAAAVDSLTNVPTDHIVALAVQVTTNGVTFAKTIGPIIVDDQGHAVEAKAYVVTNSLGEAEGSVQLPNTFVEAAAPGKAGQEAQDELQKPAAFNGGAGGVTKWHCYVLGMESAATTATTVGPYVKGVQDAKPGVIGFQMLTPAAVKAKEAGCDVKFEIEQYDSPTFAGEPVKSGKVDYDKTAEITVPSSGARYYKLKVFISPKK